MTVLSERARVRYWQIGAAVCIALLSWILQITVLNNFSFGGAVCNLPLTMTILWGFVFGSQVPQLSPDKLRTKSVGAVFAHQLSAGSSSGLLFGALFAAIAASQLPIYTISYPLIGWITGYFSPRNVNPETLLCMPMVLLASVLANIITAGQLAAGGHADIFPHLSQIALPEAVLNAIIAPFIYFPLRHWHDYNRSATNSTSL